jgi:hypothetical protein
MKCGSVPESSQVFASATANFSRKKFCYRDKIMLLGVFSVD